MKKTLLIVGIIITMAVLVLSLPFFRPAVGYITRPFAFLSGALYYVRQSIGGAGQGFFCPQKSEIDELKSQVKRLSEENVRLNTAVVENETLRAQLNFFKTLEYKHAFANVIGKINDSYASILVIDKGTKDGVVDNLAVITDNGIIIGKTASVGETTSQVVLLNDRTSKLLAMTPNKKDSSGIIEGQFGLGMVMNLIPITGEIVKDNIVVTAGLEQGIPAGLIVGTIAGVEFQQGDLFKTAQIKSAVNYDSVRIVSVLLPK